MSLVKCPECGKEISDSAVVCPNCGYPMKKNENGLSYVKESKPTNTPPKKKPNKGLMIGGIAAIVILIGVGLWLGLRGGRLFSDNDFVITEEFANTFNTNEYNIAFPFTEGMAHVWKDDKEGFIDKSGSLVIPTQSKAFANFHEGMALFSDVRLIYNNRITQFGDLYFYYATDPTKSGDSKIGYIDKSGKVVIPIQYDYACNFSEGLAVVGIDGKYGCIDVKGEVVIPLQYELLGDFHDGLAVFYKDNQFGFINKKGDIAIPAQYQFAKSFKEGLSAVVKDNKVGFIDRKGNVVVPFEFDGASSFSEGLAVTVKDNKAGFIDRKGNVVIPFEFNGASDFSEGLSAVSKDNKMGFIDKKGKVVIALEFDGVWDFHNGLAKVVKDNKIGYIDKNGQIVIPIEYDNGSDFSEGIATVVKDAIYGYVDRHGNTTITKELLQKKVEEKARIEEEERLRREEEERNHPKEVEIYISAVHHSDSGTELLETRGCSAKALSRYDGYANQVVTDVIEVPYGKMWVSKSISWNNAIPQITYNNSRYEDMPSNNLTLRGGESFRIKIDPYPLNHKAVFRAVFTEVQDY